MAVVGFKNPKGPATLDLRSDKVGPDGSHRALANEELRILYMQELLLSECGFTRDAMDMNSI